MKIYTADISNDEKFDRSIKKKKRQTLLDKLKEKYNALKLTK